MSIGKRADGIARWLYWLLVNCMKSLTGRHTRFLVLTPPISTKQIIFDMNSRRFTSVAIRDDTDYRIICDIFSAEDYALENCRSRAEDLIVYYKNIVSSGKRPLIIDCGGNSGMATRYFSNTYKEAIILCIEPDKGNINQAKENNDSESVIFIQAGVGSSDASAKLSNPGRGNWGFRVEEAVGGETKLISINSILSNPEYSNCMPFIIKIDIEGFESNMFVRNTEWIDLFPILVIELHDWMLPKQANSQAFLQEISRRNRDFIYKGENVYSVSNTLV